MGTQLPDGVQLLRTLTGHDGTIGRIGWSPDGRLLATPSMDGTVRIWDAASGDCVRVIRGRNGSVIAAAFDPDGCILATGGDGGTELWDVESWELRTTLDIGACNAVAFSPRNRTSPLARLVLLADGIADEIHHDQLHAQVRHQDLPSPAASRPRQQRDQAEDHINFDKMRFRHPSSSRR